MSARPNLFSFATSELSQDGFLCWLLAWADPSHKGSAEPLHALGWRFVDALLQAANVEPPPKAVPVQIRRQRFNIDVVVEVGDHHLLVIEDKTHSGERAASMARYRTEIAKEYGTRKLAFVYLKTGDQSSYEEVRRAGWSVYPRSSLLTLLREAKGAVEHDVFVDFLAWLESIEARFGAWRTLPVGAWDADEMSWQGLYAALQKALGQGGWGYVANASGGFHGFWWGWAPVSGGTLYAQLEQTRLVLKIDAGAVDANARSRLRDTWVSRVVGHPALPGFVRPGRLGHGQWMTVATWERPGSSGAASSKEWRVTREDGLVDLDATVQRLKDVAAALRAVAAEATPAGSPTA